MDRFSFDDSIRFEEDSLCSWSSEPESLCNNWRGWKKPTNAAGGPGAGLGMGMAPFGTVGGMGAGAPGSCGPGGSSSAMVTMSACGRYHGEWTLFISVLSGLNNSSRQYFNYNMVTPHPEIKNTQLGGVFSEI
ncbi:GL20287 [Drosophila persimilis]|uniref:GL20287 n=1 Tax=Drosophila persimilis TaxID=7234 RepID=B4GXI9_DROPE|nr:GL20287 [Drosophila persimilis]